MGHLLQFPKLSTSFAMLRSHLCVVSSRRASRSARARCGNHRRHAAISTAQRRDCPAPISSRHRRFQFCAPPAAQVAETIRSTFPPQCGLRFADRVRSVPRALTLVQRRPSLALFNSSAPCLNRVAKVVAPGADVPAGSARFGKRLAQFCPELDGPALWFSRGLDGAWGPVSGSAWITDPI
jgi:hypothetical protein